MIGLMFLARAIERFWAALPSEKESAAWRAFREQRRVWREMAGR